MRLVRAMAVLLAALLAPALHAQTDEERFARDAAQHSRDLRDLYSMRGIQSPKMRDATVADVMRYLVSQRSDASPGYPDGSAVLFYAEQEGRLNIYLIGREGLLASSSRKVSPGDLELAATEFRLGLDVDGIARSRAPKWRGDPALVEPVAQAAPAKRAPRRKKDPTEALSALLLPDEIRPALQQVRHLVVIANGVVGSNPFAMLPLDRDTALIDRMSVSVSPGLFDLDQMIPPWRMEAAFRNALIVGDPEVPASPEWQVPRLPGAEEEARLLAERTNVPALLGAEATKQAVLGRINSASTLYFAAHGVSNPMEPLTGGFLMLAGPDPQSAFLTASEVQNRRLQAGLAVLSACQSGIGMNHDGGVIGLARSFQKAGVPRVVMSLWSVDDQATLYLMQRFHEHATTVVPAEALRLAMLDTRTVHPDPALWAAFTLFGTPR